MLGVLLAAAARAGAETEMLLLRKMNVRTCRGCLACEKGGRERKGICKIDDDMNDVYPELLTADVIVLATPGYMGMLSGLLKNFLDRTCAVWPRLEGKMIAGLAVAEESTGQSIQNFRAYASLLKMKWAGSVTALAKNPGDAARDKKLEGRLVKLGGRLAALEI